MRDEQERIYENMDKRGRLEAQIESLKKLLSNEPCPTCGQMPLVENRPAKQADLAQCEGDLLGLKKGHEDLAIISSEMREIDKLLRPGVGDRIQSLKAEERTLSVELTKIDNEIERIEEKIRGYDTEEIASKRRIRDMLVRNEGQIDGDISKTEAELKGIRNELEILSKQISNQPAARQRRSTAKVELCQGLVRVFTQSIERLRDNLRSKVEERATDTFKRLTTQAKYRGLEINVNYGLTIIDENGEKVPSATRNRLGAYRFKALAGYPPSRDIMVDGLMFAPPWIIRLPTKALYLPVRATNRLREIGAETVADIARIGAAGLMHVPNLGRKTVSDISEAIFIAFEHGSAFCDTHAFRQAHLPEIPRPDVHEPQGEPEPQREAKIKNEPPYDVLGPRSFREAIHLAFTLITARDASVLRQRMGIGGSRKTLEEIAKNHSVTRERIRQIESKAINQIILRMPVWEGHLKEGLARMLQGRQTPLPLLALDVLDPWFAGADTLSGPFEFALEHFTGPPEFDVIRVSGQSYVSMLRQDEWNEAERASRALLASLSKREKAPSELETRLLIESQLVGNGEELRPLLWDTVTRWAHFSEGPSGEKILVSYGMGAESLVEAVLSESDTPLHYSEIAKRCASKGRPIDVRRAANAAANVGYLLGRGIYGLQKHIDLSKEEQSRVLGEVEEMLSETPGRQWHAAEISDELEARGLDFEGRLSKYDLNVILESSIVLAYLGRMVWTTKTKSSLGTSDRLNIWQAIIALLQQHGSPMFASDIRETISRDRGLGSTFQIHQADPLIRVGENEWGMLWRDIPFDEDHANAIVEEMISVLQEKGSGLHTSEIVSSLKVNRDLAATVNPIMLVALAIRTERVKPGKGGYVYLPEWEGPRRLTVSEAVEKSFDLFDGGVLAADVAKKASELLGREVANNTATSVLMKIGTYDLGKGLWFHSEEDGAETMEGSTIVTDESMA